MVLSIVAASAACPCLLVTDIGVHIELPWKVTYAQAVRRVYETIQFRYAGVKHTRGARGPMLDAMVEGHIAEYVVGEFLGVEPLEQAGPDTFDLPGKIEVKHTPYRSGGLLVAPERLKDDGRYVLVTGWLGRYVIEGWVPGYEVRTKGELCDPSRRGRPPTYRVDKSRLYDARALRDEEG